MRSDVRFIFFNTMDEASRFAVMYNCFAEKTCSWYFKEYFGYSQVKDKAVCIFRSTKSEFDKIAKDIGLKTKFGNKGHKYYVFE